jgi:diguanylate cyclase (GGDEF)-like protein
MTVCFKKRGGDEVWLLISASVIEIESTKCVLTVMRDISDARAAEDEIRHLAFYDTLTRLPNRRMLMDQLDSTLTANLKVHGRQAALLVDLDDFKTLNDTMGHQTGDLLLLEVARCLLSCIRAGDTVSRVGGDEFVVILRDLSEIPEEAAFQAMTVAEKIQTALNRPYILSEHEVYKSACIGVALIGPESAGASDVLKQTEIALFKAKGVGRDSICFFAPDLQAAVNARATLEDSLRVAIGANEFLLYYQPQVDSTGLIGAEALIRWKHQERGILAPGEFISLAEETGLIVPLGLWILEAACKQIALWAAHCKSSRITLAVNISARQFRHPDFVRHTLAVLERTGANPKNLKLELTESMLVQDIEDVIAKMTLLKSHGLRFSMDDFGTGYSSLSYLKRMPLDQLKIDRAFVRDILVDTASDAIAQTIISLGRAMHMSVIAEGVETEEQREFLSSLGCHAFQGFLYSRPLPLDEFERLWLHPAA